MSHFLEALEAGPILADGATGSYLFQRTGRLSEPNHVYEALNLDSPGLVREVHTAYLRAGARCLTTNTFGANRAQLLPLGEAARVVEINRAGVRLAREAIADFQRQAGDERPCFVLGSIGPTPAADEPAEGAAAIYREQVFALVDEGVDALIVETFTSMAQVAVVLGVVGEHSHPPPVIVHIAPREEGGRWEQDHVRYVEQAARLGARIVGVNCCAPWEAEEFLDAARAAEPAVDGRVLLSAMPNAGGFQRIRHRYMSHVNPEYMGRAARTFAARGARLVGGCCEVHPP
ncbi:MAG: homocysteine S-methyltransferase family protein, partial [Dehalococcoidia bacterium]